MQFLRVTACLAVLSLSAHAADMDDVGTIKFPTSASGEAQQHFLRGVAILHSFGWKQARTEFQRAQELDPGFALAYWGEAQTYNHPLIAEWDLETPQVVLMRLGSTRAERLAKAPTEREKGFMLAVDELFLGKGDTMARRKSYMQAMRSLHERFPDDDEVAAYYALSLLMSAGPAGEGHRQNVLAGAIAMDISRRNPKHPGAVHYTIHAFDDPVHAPMALSAAYVFDDIAPAVSHARHMPTHIFIQHGMWQEVSDSNEDAFQVAEDLWEPGDNAGDMAHALDWGQYGDLQLGDHERAAMWIERMEFLAKNRSSEPRVIAALPRVKARMILETERWKTGPVTANTSNDELFATGISAVRLGNLKLAKDAATQLAVAAKALSGTDRSYYAETSRPVEIMHLSVAGLVAIAEGQTEKGLNMLAKGVDVAEAMRPPNGPATPLKPVHELYGEALLAANKPDQAVEQFATSLSRTPNRPLSLLGLARSYAAVGEEEAAKEQYQKLAEIWKNRDFPAVEEASQYLASVNSD